MSITSAADAGMTATSWAFLVVAGVAAVGDWLSVSGAFPRMRAAQYACKPAVPVALALVALTLRPTDPTLRGYVVAFLLCCLVGDVLLMLPVDTTPVFGVGLGAFAVAHVLLIVGIALSMHGGAGWVVVALVGLGAVSAPAAVTVVRAVASSHRALLAPVCAYLAVLLVMVAIALAAGAGAGRTYVAGALVAGGLCFLVSDTLLAVDRFVRPVTGATVAVHATYHAALALLVVSLVAGPGR